jgi:hypothetical protein
MWICPSKGRPERLKEFSKSWPANVPVKVILAEDDSRLVSYPTIPWPDTWTFDVCPLRGVGPTLEWVFQKYPQESFYGLLGDDVVLEHGHPDSLVALAGEWFLAFPDDGVQGHRLATHPVLGGKLVRAVGRLAPEVFYHSYIDTYWDCLARSTSMLRYNPQVRYEHRHPVKYPELMDDTYRESMSAIDSDADAWRRLVQDNRLQRDAQRVREAVVKAFHLRARR